ncbi:hypothetical protein SDC9_76193 [bioreactor metagenome]|uniref:Uncharacterized protein n=1 Tax=bioreactor metagenome TaxID=1076179 RepID=A0A644YT53_9ZZZZ
MRHNSYHYAVVFGGCYHVFHKHQIGFFACFGCKAVLKTVRQFHSRLGVVLRERRICDDTVELARKGWIFFVRPMRLTYGVTMLNIRIFDIVHYHIHLANRPHGSRVVLSEQRQVVGSTAVFFDILLAVNQHTTRADRWVIYAHPRLRLYQSHHKLHHRGWGIEFSTLFAGTVGEVFNHIFIRCPEQIRKDKIVISQPILIKMRYQFNQFGVINYLF